MLQADTQESLQKESQMSVTDVIVGVPVNLTGRESQWGHFIFRWIQTPQTFPGNITLARHLLFTFFFLAAAEDNKEVPGLEIGLVMVGLRTRIGIDIEQYSVFLGGVGKENMTWILTLGLSGWAPRRKGKPSM